MCTISSHHWAKDKHLRKGRSWVIQRVFNRFGFFITFNFRSDNIGGHGNQFHVLAPWLTSTRFCRVNIVVGVVVVVPV